MAALESVLPTNAFIHTAMPPPGAIMKTTGVPLDPLADIAPEVHGPLKNARFFVSKH